MRYVRVWARDVRTPQILNKRLYFHFVFKFFYGEHTCILGYILLINSKVEQSMIYVNVLATVSC